MQSTSLLLLAGLAAAGSVRHGSSAANSAAAAAAKREAALAATTLARCNADNCARAVTGTHDGLATRTAHLLDCSSFFALTVIPATSTSLVTVIPAPVTAFTTETTIYETSVIVETLTVSTYVSTTDIELGAAAKRSAEPTITAPGYGSPPGATTVYPTSVPAYAGACSGTARYSSACACLGLTYSTSTASTPVVTSTITAAPSTVVLPATAVVVSEVTSTVVAGLVAVDTIPCGTQIVGQVDGYRISVQCNVVPSPTPEETVVQQVVNDWDACVRLADSEFDGSSFLYDLSTHECTVYHDADGTFATTGSGGRQVAYGHFNEG